MNKAYIALGSNIEPRLRYLSEAEEKLAESESVQIKCVSSVYETIPVGYEKQGDFLNKVIEVETTLKPLQLLKLCQRVERELGRERDVRWGPRTIDLDILLYNLENMNTDELILPHPRMHERAFVMQPLVEVNPDIEIPGFGDNALHLLRKLSTEERRGVVKWKTLK